MAAVGLLAHLNPDCPVPLLRERFGTILREHPHYRAIGLFSAAGQLLGFAGIWIATKIWCGRYLEVDNLVVHPLHRAGGAGTALLRHLEELGRAEDCNILVLDSYTSNHASHRLYHRLGYEIWGFHFIRPLRSFEH
jgi:GNAT superfamily N-acetyltransferase